VEKAAVRWSRVLASVVPAWPIGKATNSTRPRCFLKTEMKGEYFLLFRDIIVAVEGSEKCDLDEDRGGFLLVERGQVWRGSLGTPLV
jgi:hypothetical protein